MAELKNLIVEGDTRLIDDTNAGKVTATSFVKSGGTSSQFLKADGSVDSTAYSTLAIGTTATTAAAGNHTHSTSIATSTGTNQLTLAANTKYALTAGGTSFVFTTPPDNNSVTGVKGNSESSYRTGNVNITATNIGLGNVGNFKAVSTVASQGLTDTEKSNARTNIGAGTSSLAIGTTGTTAAAGNHTHTTSIGLAEETATLDLDFGESYQLTAGGTSSLFAMPALGTTSTTACAGNDSRLHSPSSLTAQTTQAVYPIKIGANGHITAYGSAVTIPTVPTFSSLTLSTTAQKYDGTHTLALPSSDPYSSARTPSSHTHGNIQNGGTLQTTDVAIANGDKLVVTDSSDSSKVARTSLSFDGSTATKCLTQKGTWESFTNNSGTITKVGNTSSGNVSVTSNNNTASFGSAVTVGTVGGVDLKFTMPANPDTNTHRPINVNGTQALGNNTTALNLKKGTGISIYSAGSGNVEFSQNPWDYRASGEWSTSGLPWLYDDITENTTEVWLQDEGGSYRVLHLSYYSEENQFPVSFDCMDLDGSNRFCYYRLDVDSDGAITRWRCRREGVTVFDYENGGD